MPDGSRFGNFETLKNYLKKSGERLVFATNAGIFEPGFAPTGLYMEGGREYVPLNLTDGVGNFYVKPNGIFRVDTTGASIVSADKFTGSADGIRLATQSGPLLLLNGEINPQFKTNSDSTRIRSGVGVVSPKQIVFAISNDPVAFYEFASLFRDRLGCKDALYLDGSISKFYPEVTITGGAQSDFAGILAITEKKR
jgi:uncharacterized protein YigE (DUF2233 family)